ncbi:hypothetical protein HD554DRAFT_2260081 [Boletus coccyginus]|nr:hypothetical protein HD554DRAFT_2260081 [Boletus coccyginus]
MNGGAPSRTRIKRDSLMAELERGKSPPLLASCQLTRNVPVDPQHLTAKRQQRLQAFSSHMTQATLERKLLSAQAAKTELENKLRQKEVYIEQLEGDRRFLTEREQAEQEEKEKERKANAEEKKNAEADLRSLRDAISTLRNEHIKLEESNAELEQELVEYRAIAEERDATIRALQQKLDEAEVASDPMLRRHNEDEQWGVIRDELHRQASYLRSLETTNAKLDAELGRYKDRYTNLEVLREEKRALERKVVVVDELREKVASLEAQVEAARRERQEWANKSSEAGMPSGLSLSVIQSLSELRLTHVRLLEEHGANIAVLRSREAELARINESLLEAQRTLETSQGEVQMLKDKVARREQRTQLAEREVGFLQALVASFTAEDQASHEVPTLDSGDGVLGGGWR